MICTRKEAMEEYASVRNLPQYASDRKAPNSGAKFVVPKKMLAKLAAATCCILNSFTKYTVKFARSPIDATFSNVSFP